MEITLLNEHVAFGPQVMPELIAGLAEHGFEQLICNRPDNEEPHQPSIDSIRAAAEAHGIAVIYAPVGGTQLDQAILDSTREALDNNKKTLMYCRSGMRSSVLWAMVQLQQGAPMDETFNQLAAIGYDAASMKDYVLSIMQQNGIAVAAH